MAALAVACAYLAGCVPTGLLLARRAGVDVRAVGSGNIGATNVARTTGLRLGLLTLAGDALKGCGPVLLARAFGAPDPLTAWVAGATVVGHVYPITLRFRGGKGVATAFGALLAIAPAVAIGLAALFAALLWASGRVSVGSIAAAMASPVALAATGAPAPHAIAFAGIAILVVLRHRENIGRLLEGTEPRFRPPRR